MGTLTKREKILFKLYGNDPNYRIETNERNQIVVVQLKPEKSSMQRFIDGEEFTLEVYAFGGIRYRFDEKTAQITNKSGVDPIAVLAAFSHGFLYKQGNSTSSLINFTEIKFVGDEKSK